jgi:hypothetical protein
VGPAGSRGGCSLTYTTSPVAGQATTFALAMWEGPGYRNAVGSSAATKGGIQPELVIELALSHAHAPVETLAFNVQYDALAWATTQPDLKGVIQDK